MCGIMGYVGESEAAPVLLEGLARLEYRGYDSAGVAVQGEDGRIEAMKAAGKLQNLVRRTDAGRALRGRCGIGHTRWATHGAPDETNAHPHLSPDGRVALVHNGIIENHRALRAMLLREGAVFKSETDSEAAALLLGRCYDRQRALAPQARAMAAIREMMGQLEGSYALGILFGDEPGAIYAVRKDSPLILGRCEAGGHVLSSDVPAALGLTREVIYMENMEIARIDRGSLRLYDAEGREVKRPFTRITWSAAAAQKGGCAHFMLKEIMEQSQAVRDTLAPRVRRENGAYAIDLGETGLTDDMLSRVEQVVVLGCGSAYHAGLSGAAAIERLARLPARAELASEFRYREPVLAGKTLAVVVSQSGETADSLAALRLCKSCGVMTLAVVNVVGSSIAREADAALLTWAGPEISVATTKAYAAQLAALSLLAVKLAALRGAMDGARAQAFTGEMLALPEKIAGVLAKQEEIRAAAQALAGSHDAFFIGRGLDVAVCMEGSLKLKEVSYIHSEAYAAGELKHGTISLIEPGVPVVAVATQAAMLPKMLANMAEVRARGARVLAVASEGLEDMDDAADAVIALPRTDEALAASLAAPALQLLAYFIGCAKGLDVDKPRNLAKSVTVE